MKSAPRRGAAGENGARDLDTANGIVVLNV